MGPAELDDRELGYIDLLCSALFFLLDSCFLLFLSSFFSFFLVPSSSIVAPSWLILAPSWAILAPSWAILAPQRPPQASSSKRGLQKLIVFWSKTQLESGGHILFVFLLRGWARMVSGWGGEAIRDGHLGPGCRRTKREPYADAFGNQASPAPPPQIPFSPNRFYCADGVRMDRGSKRDGHLGPSCRPTKREPYANAFGKNDAKMMSGRCRKHVKIMSKWCPNDAPPIRPLMSPMLP